MMQSLPNSALLCHTPGSEIAGSHWPFSVHFSEMAAHVCTVEGHFGANHVVLCREVVLF